MLIFLRFVGKDYAFISCWSELVYLVPSDVFELLLICLYFPVVKFGLLKCLGLSTSTKWCISEHILLKHLVLK